MNSDMRSIPDLKNESDISINQSIRQTGDGVGGLSGTACGDSAGETCPVKPASAAAAELWYRGNGAVRPTDG